MRSSVVRLMSGKGASATAAAVGMSAGERKLVRTLYKALICSARTFEAEPALKALIFRRTLSPLMLTSPVLQEEAAEEAAAPSPTAQLMESYYDEFLGSRATRFYNPNLSSRSLLSMIRDRFRQPLSQDPDAREQRMDAGFQVVKELESALALGRKAGLIIVSQTESTENDASSTTTTTSAYSSLSQRLATAAKFDDIGPGMLLVPHPLLQDPFWQHTVILLLSYTPASGAVGAVINRPESRLFSIGKKSAKKQDSKRLFKGFYGGPVGLPELYWLSKADPTSIPPAEEVMPGLYHGRTLAIFDWNSEQKEEDKAATTQQHGNLVIENQDQSQPSKDEKKGGPIKAQPTIKEEDMWSDPNTKFFFGHAAWVPEQLEGELQEGTWFVARPEGLGAVFPYPPLFGSTTMPPAEVVDVADREKQSRLWGNILADMGGAFAPIAKFASLPRRVGKHSDEDEDASDDDDDEDTYL